MALGRGTKYKLPKFPSHIIPTYKGLCEVLPAENVPTYRQEIERVLNHMRSLAQSNPNLNIEMAEELAKRCYMLLDLYPTLASEKQALVAGGLRYFVITDDGLSETSFATGLDDDARVINYVLEQCGIEDQFIRI